MCLLGKDICNPVLKAWIILIHVFVIVLWYFVVHAMLGLGFCPNPQQRVILRAEMREVDFDAANLAMWFFIQRLLRCSLQPRTNKYFS